MVLLGERGIDVDEIEVFVELFEGAVKAVAEMTLWEGDGTWSLSAIPDVERAIMWMMFLIKQQNNGTTFIASMVELPWLEEWRCRKPRSEPGDDSRSAFYIERLRTLSREVIEQRYPTN